MYRYSDISSMIPDTRCNYEIDLKPKTWNPAFGKTIAMYLEDRAIQLYDYAIVQKKETDLGDPNQLFEQCLFLRVHKRK